MPNKDGILPRFGADIAASYNELTAEAIFALKQFQILKKFPPSDKRKWER
jgi:hypothetical protein